ncbi:Haloacetate dehalogenase H-1 [Serratia ficaria]|uniref:alpha/beta fold hydrolase n=1 Tax=Serratia ficaria TaxID=61651 RepID=UPI00218337CC|nr:alpha/beta hydrolase [Serratia ficaria]CAI2536264.1 Haloacetate dehalogenase H-1 [Serratia ficaria]
MIDFNTKSFFTFAQRKVVYHHYSPKKSIVTILMLHGFSEHSFIWLRTVEELAENLHCDFIIPDLSGHGFSDWREKGDYNISNYADDIERVIEGLNLQSIILVGHSMGGRIAKELVLRKFPVVKGMILVDFCPGIEGSQSADAMLENFKKATSRSWTPDEYKNFLILTRPLIPEEELDWVVSQLLSARQGEGFLRVDPRIAHYHSDKKFASKHQCREVDLANLSVSIIRGQYSSFVSEEQARNYLKAFQFSSYFSVPKCGHGLIIENNRGFNKTLLQSLISIFQRNQMKDVMG